ncbi:tol-pal system YbgF family protein [Streptomyces sp. NPDC058783]|uniref:tetratricopeptide repeat protein n=1 Tax=Streptomyces sp. NPDC058783 TaxID=3346633 RepID=UPI003699985E
MPRRRTRNGLLAQLLAEADLSAAQLARDVNRLAAAQGMSLRYDRTAVAHWLAGSRPKAPVPEFVAQALTRRTGRPINPEETGLAETAADDGWDDEVERGRPGDPLRSLVILARTDADPAQRSRLVRAAFRQSVPPGLEPVGLPRDVRLGVRGAQLGEADVERTRYMSEQFAMNWSLFGGGHGRSASASYLSEDVGRLLLKPASPTLREDLLAVVGQLAHTLGDMAADAGHQGLAQRYYYAALMTAAENQDRRTRAITLRALSVQAIRMGALPYAIDLADRAFTAAGAEDGDDLRAFVLVQRAYARVLSGESRRTVYRDMDTAEACLDRADSRPGPFTCYPKAGMAYRKGLVLLRLGETPAALDALRYAAEDRPSHERRRRALSQVRVALVLLDLGQVDEACVYGRLFTEEYPFLRSQRSAVLLKELQARLVRFRRVPEAVALLNRISHLAAGPGTVRSGAHAIDTSD